MGRIRSGRRMKKKRRKEGRLDTVHERNTLLKSCYIEKSNGSKVNQNLNEISNVGDCGKNN